MLKNFALLKIKFPPFRHNQLRHNKSNTNFNNEVRT